MEIEANTKSSRLAYEAQRPWNYTVSLTLKFHLCNLLFVISTDIMKYWSCIFLALLITLASRGEFFSIV